MPEYRSFLTRIFPCQDGIKNSVLILELRVKENPYSGIFYAMVSLIFSCSKKDQCWKTIKQKVDH